MIGTGLPWIITFPHTKKLRVSGWTPRFVTTVVDDSSVMLNDLVDLLKETVLSKIDSPVMAMYDVKVAGEASSNAHTRQPPLRVPQLKRSIQAFAGVRGCPGDEDA